MNRRSSYQWFNRSNYDTGVLFAKIATRAERIQAKQGTTIKTTLTVRR